MHIQTASMPDSLYCCCPTDAHKTGVANEALKGARALEQMTVQEARMILGLQDTQAPWSEVMKVCVGGGWEGGVHTVLARSEGCFHLHRPTQAHKHRPASYCCTAYRQHHKLDN
jgi:hypothetical protein